MKLILASQSPRRQELLQLFGQPFVVRVSDIDETMDHTKLPFDEVARVSRRYHRGVPGQGAGQTPHPAGGCPDAAAAVRL